jgi:hypothetical protein
MSAAVASMEVGTEKSSWSPSRTSQKRITRPRLPSSFSANDTLKASELGGDMASRGLPDRARTQATERATPSPSADASQRPPLIRRAATVCENIELWRDPGVIGSGQLDSRPLNRETGPKSSGRAPSAAKGGLRIETRRDSVEPSVPLTSPMLAFDGQGSQVAQERTQSTAGYVGTHEEQLNADAFERRMAVTERWQHALTAAYVDIRVVPASKEAADLGEPVLQGRFEKHPL